MNTEAELSEMPLETEAVQEDGPVRQGDIIVFHNRDPPWRDIGLIVTADCDIIQEKHGGTLSYVPVIPLREYWRLITLPKRVSRSVAKLREAVFGRVRSLQKTYRADFRQPLSDSAIDDLLRLGTESILDALGAPEEGRPGMRRQIDAYKSAVCVTTESSIENLAERLRSLRIAANPAASGSIEQILNELPQTVDDLPGDAFFVGRIPMHHEVGFVAYLRLVREINVGSIATTPADLRQSGALAGRTARLLSPFVYRMTQQLAQVFSDIGLPSQYEKRRSRVATLVLERLALSTQKENS